MARKHARLLIGIWDDDDYKSLGLELQGLYCALLAYPRISWCGIIDYIPKRLVRIDPSLTEKALWEKLVSLHKHDRMIQIDTSTDEMLVRTFIKHDEIMKQPNVAKAMAKAIGDIQSWDLRCIVISELGKLYIEQPDLKGWGHEGLEQGFGDLLEEVYAAAEDITTFRRTG
jgi:hypothetical protein